MELSLETRNLTKRYGRTVAVDALSIRVEPGRVTGFVGPKGLPQEVVTRLNAAVAAVVNEPAIRQRLIDEGAEIRLTTPAEFGAFMRAENLRWAKVIQEAGVTPQ